MGIFVNDYSTFWFGKKTNRCAVKMYNYRPISRSSFVPDVIYRNVEKPSDEKQRWYWNLAINMRQRDGQSLRMRVFTVRWTLTQLSCLSANLRELATSWRLLTVCLSSSSSICVRDQTQRVELTIDKTSGAEMNHDPAGGLCDAMGTISMPRKWRLGNGRAITATFTVVCAALLFFALFLHLCRVSTSLQFSDE